MLSEDKIQRAHDLIEPVVRGEVPWPDRFDIADKAAMMGALRALCWVLGDHNRHEFAIAYRSLEDELGKLGLRLGEPMPFPMRKEPGRG